MAFTRDSMLERLLESYRMSYDIEQDLNAQDRPELAAKAHFHVFEQRYMISKKAEMYHTNSDEYVWFFSMPHLTDKVCEACIKYAHDEGMAQLDHSAGDQMVTRLVAVFLCDEADDEALQRIQKCKIYKSFQFSLKGWMEFHAAAAVLGKETAVSNRYGRETGEHLKNLMHPRPPRRKLGDRLFDALFRRKKGKEKGE